MSSMPASFTVTIDIKNSLDEQVRNITAAQDEEPIRSIPPFHSCDSIRNAAIAVADDGKLRGIED